MAKTMAVTIDEEKCTACGTCVEACPVEALKINGKCKVDEETCIDCGACVDECPEEAISL
jgi:NAD-dependent dihydropyrimidine dehydrogenase PreA subunit